MLLEAGVFFGCCCVILGCYWLFSFFQSYLCFGVVQMIDCQVGSFAALLMECALAGPLPFAKDFRRSGKKPRNSTISKPRKTHI